MSFSNHYDPAVKESVFMSVFQYLFMLSQPCRHVKVLTQTTKFNFGFVFNKSYIILLLYSVFFFLKLPHFCFDTKNIKCGFCFYEVHTLSVFGTS